MEYDTVMIENSIVLKVKSTKLLFIKVSCTSSLQSLLVSGKTS